MVDDGIKSSVKSFIPSFQSNSDRYDAKTYL